LSQVAYSRQPFYSLAGKSQNILEENVSIPKISEEAKKPSLSENFRDMKNVDYYYRRSSIEKNNADDISSRSKAVGGEDGGDLGIAKAGDREDPYDGTSIVSHAKRVLCWEFKPVGPAQTSQQLLCTEKSISLTELVDESGARLRDLRPLQPLVQHRYSSALVRSRSIIFLIFPYKAIIYHNKVEIFHSNDMQLSDTIRRTFASRMRKTTSTCFEMRALECLLIEVIEFWATEFEKIFPRTEALLSRISSRQSGEDLQMMLNMTHQLNYISHHVHNVVKAISEVLNSDEDMSRMYLTERSQEVPIFRAISDHEEVELLFETFQHAAMELEGRIGALKMDVHLTNQFLEIHFDSQRNKLMRFNIFLTTGTLAVSAMHHQWLTATSFF
tara:strand:- start:1716 stop:2873 length:1158 start_codon:yes stop_codon:yes gene_type:complete